MEFTTLYQRLSPKLKMAARRLNGHGHFIDENDLYQEMCIYLWNTYKSGVPEEVNDAYITIGCEFHARNYIRKNKARNANISLDLPVGEEGDTLQDMIPDSREPARDTIERETVMDDIEASALKGREREVFSLLRQGYTVREVGEKVGISHVMVVKYKKRLTARCGAAAA